MTMSSGAQVCATSCALCSASSRTVCSGPAPGVARSGPLAGQIVLSGTDSLGFLFTEDEQLYDRCVLLHTTFIPYREFESVLGVHGIDEYIRYGGTMSLGGVHYNETSTFASKESTDEYVDTAIARNIQHSLRCYQYEGHFRHLRDL